MHLLNILKIKIKYKINLIKTTLYIFNILNIWFLRQNFIIYLFNYCTKYNFKLTCFYIMKHTNNHNNNNINKTISTPTTILKECNDQKLVATIHKRLQLKRLPPPFIIKKMSQLFTIDLSSPKTAI
jgi:hypothetical protein